MSRRVLGGVDGGQLHPPAAIGRVLPPLPGQVPCSCLRRRGSCESRFARGLCYPKRLRSLPGPGGRRKGWSCVFPGRSTGYPYVDRRATDRRHWCLRETGFAASHHLTLFPGTTCVLVSFPFIFSPCLGCKENTPQWAAFIYYLPFIVIFQFGWAATQVSHLSLIPELVTSDHEKVELTLSLAFWNPFLSPDCRGGGWMMGRQRAPPALLTPLCLTQNLSLIVVGLGALFSLIFHLGTKEKPYPPGSLPQLEEGTPLLQKEPPTPSSPLLIWRDWLLEPAFYQVRLRAELVVPLMASPHLSSQLGVPVSSASNTTLGSELSLLPCPHAGPEQLTYFVGILVILAFASWVMLARQMGAEIYGAAALLGAGSATILVTSLSMTADLIGTNTHSGAFVYGSMSFTDKMANGLAVMVIQNLHPCPTELCCPACVTFYHWVMVLVTGGIAVAAVAALCCIMIWDTRRWGPGRTPCAPQLRSPRAGGCRVRPPPSPGAGSGCVAGRETAR
uniref:Major facilitator superfamily domain containing 12 n=1 Tax=Calidris pygmaea TaxID=425635 RepID=A0A8C3PHA0_9CHAR